MTLQNMNQLRLVPRKDYVANRLLSGALQLAANTSLYLDETQLEQGQLDPAGEGDPRAGWGDGHPTSGLGGGLFCRVKRLSMGAFYLLVGFAHFSVKGNKC